jgi:NitT/TauT family transport system permease protein
MRLQHCTSGRRPGAVIVAPCGDLKVAISLAVIGAVIGDFVGAEAGLGHMIVVSGSNVGTSLAFGAMVLLAVLSVGLFYALVGLERLLVPWTRYEER